MEQKSLDELLWIYAELTEKAKDLTDRKEFVKRQIEEMLPQEPWDKETELGKYKLVENKKWTYSEDYNRMAEDLKILKEDEQESGVATFETVYSLRFNPNKA